MISHKPISNRRRQKKVLFVDDEPDMTTLLKMALKYAGFSVDVFNDPLLALYDEMKKIDGKLRVCFITATYQNYEFEIKDLVRKVKAELE